MYIKKCSTHTNCIASPKSRTMFCSAKERGATRRTYAQPRWNIDSTRMRVKTEMRAMVGDVVVVVYDLDDGEGVTVGTMPEDSRGCTQK